MREGKGKMRFTAEDAEGSEEGVSKEAVRELSPFATHAAPRRGRGSCPGCPFLRHATAPELLKVFSASSVSSAVNACRFS